MKVTKTNTGDWTGSGTSIGASQSFTVPAGSNKLVVVLTVDFGVGSPAATYNGVTVPLRVSATNNRDCYIFVLDSPATGANTLAVSWTTSRAYHVMAFALSGASPGIGKTATNTGTGTAPSASVTECTVNGLVIDGLAFGSGTPTAGASQVEHSNKSVPGCSSGRQVKDTEDDTSLAMSWTITSQAYALAAVEIPPDNSDYWLTPAVASAGSTQADTGVTSISISSISLPNAPLDALLVGLSVDAGITSPSCTFDGQSMTLIASRAGTNRDAYIYMLLNPPKGGSRTLTASWTTGSQAVLGYWQVSNLKQSAVARAVTSVDNNFDIDYTAESVTGCPVFTVTSFIDVGCGDSGAWATGNAFTNRWYLQTTGGTCAGGARIWPCQGSEYLGGLRDPRFHVVGSSDASVAVSASLTPALKAGGWVHEIA